MKALIIDDVPLIQDLHRKMLLESGVSEVVVAATAEQGLYHLEVGRFDLVVLDIHLPDRSGLEVLQEIRKRDRGLFVVVATGYEEPETVQEIVRLGANRYLVKPVELSAVMQVVDLARR